jgi:hypothetical protein
MEYSNRGEIMHYQRQKSYLGLVRQIIYCSLWHAKGLEKGQRGAEHAAKSTCCVFCPSYKHFPPCPYFVHPVDVKPPVFGKGTLFHSFLHTKVHCCKSSERFGLKCEFSLVSNKYIPYIGFNPPAYMGKLTLYRTK